MLTLPIAALVVPLLIFYLVMTVFSLRHKSKYPKQLFPPQWYRVGSGWYYSPYKERFEKENSRLKAEIEELKIQLRNTKKK